MKKFIFFIFFISFCFSQKIDLRSFKSGKRGDKYRIWIYFKDKADSEKISVSQKAQQRRLDHGTKSDYSWYDLKVSSKYINSIQSLGLKIENKSRWLNAVSVICSQNDINIMDSLPYVKKIEPVKGFKKKYFEIGEDIHPSSRDFDYGNSQAQIEQINVHELHNQGFTGNGVRILVMDTGFDLTHHALTNINVIAQWDVINNDIQTANENDEEQDIGQDYHGTVVLSTIAANAPGELVGTAFDAEFLLAKTEDVSQEIQQEEDDYVSGLEWGEANGADVVSTSLGYLDWYNYSDMDGNTAVTTIGVDIAVSLGVVCVTAAGNSGNDDWYYIIAPADADSVISVGAVWENGEIASFSSHGPTFDGRIKPEVCARGRYTWCISGNNSTDYTQASGTSLSCPLIAGATALIIQARPTWSPMEVRESILMTSSMADSANNTYGYGIMNAAAAIEYWSTSGTNELMHLPNNYNIVAAYPNPFNPSINIEVTSIGTSIIKVSIFSFNGKFIKNLFHGNIINSTEIIQWEPDNISSGIYLVRLVNNRKESVYRKITYIK